MILLLSLLWFGIYPASIPAQEGTGVLTVLVITVSGEPIANASVTFAAEGERAPRTACVTDAAGTCALFVAGVPTDASGLLRGYLHIGAAYRPVIWPGGNLAITITTSDNGRIRPKADLIDSARGTPTATAIPTTVAGPFASPAPRTTPALSLTPTPDNEATITPLSLSTATVSPAVAPERTGVARQWAAIPLLVTLLLLSVGVVRRRQHARKERPS